jgi:hypothetical protein
MPSASARALGVWSGSGSGRMDGGPVMAGGCSAERVDEELLIRGHCT